MRLRARRGAAWLLVAGMATLGGCTGSGSYVPVEDRTLSTPGSGTSAAPARPEPGSTESAAEVSTSPAVVALLGGAERARVQGEPAGAVANIERALRIEPRNPHLWQALAEVKLDQGKPLEAENLAGRALTLGPEPALARRSWRLIAEARRRRGDAAGARQAEEEAGRRRP